MQNKSKISRVLFIILVSLCLISLFLPISQNTRPIDFLNKDLSIIKQSGNEYTKHNTNPFSMWRGGYNNIIFPRFNTSTTSGQNGKV